MKTFAIVLLCVSTSLLANTPETVFSESSPLPLKLQKLIIQEVTEKCPEIVIENGLSEASTEVRDDGSFNTTLRSRFFIDRGWPYTAYIYVLSKNSRVQSIKGCDS